jgi:hypothetical protein
MALVRASSAPQLIGQTGGRLTVDGWARRRPLEPSPCRSEVLMVEDLREFCEARRSRDTPTGYRAMRH